MNHKITPKDPEIMSQGFRRSRGHLIGAVVDVGFFVLLALLFRAHWILGLVAGGVLLAVVFGFMPLPGILFRELDEPAELPREKPARESPLLPRSGALARWWRT